MADKRSRLIREEISETIKPVHSDDGECMARQLCSPSTILTKQQIVMHDTDDLPNLSLCHQVAGKFKGIVGAKILVDGNPDTSSITGMNHSLSFLVGVGKRLLHEDVFSCDCERLNDRATNVGGRAHDANLPC